MIRSFVVVTGVAFAQSAVSVADTKLADLRAAVEAETAAVAAKFDCAFAVAVRGAVELDAVAGRRSAGGSPVETDDVFVYGSITKVCERIHLIFCLTPK